MREFMTGNHAVAHAVKLCRTPLIVAYPITPQTPIYEKLSEWEASGTLKGIMMRTESEHSAMASCIAASLMGLERSQLHPPKLLVIKDKKLAEQYIKNWQEHGRDSEVDIGRVHQTINIL